MFSEKKFHITTLKKRFTDLEKKCFILKNIKFILYSKLLQTLIIILLSHIYQLNLFIQLKQIKYQMVERSTYKLTEHNITNFYTNLWIHFIYFKLSDTFNVIKILLATLKGNKWCLTT